MSNLIVCQKIKSISCADFNKKSALTSWDTYIYQLVMLY